MNIRKIATSVFAVALMVLPSTPMAAENVELYDIIHVEKVKKNDKGEEETVLEEAKNAKVVPGNTIRSTIYYKNSGDTEASDVALRSRVPENTVYIEGSAEGQGSNVTFSVDGGKSFNKPSELFVKGTDGKKKKAQASDYTHIMWVVSEIKPGKEGHVLFRAKIE